MARLISITALSLTLLGGPVLAQTAGATSDAQEEAKREQRVSCADRESERSHALKELCNWVGQYR